MRHYNEDRFGYASYRIGKKVLKFKKIEDSWKRPEALKRTKMKRKADVPTAEVRYEDRCLNLAHQRNRELRAKLLRVNKEIDENAKEYLIKV